MKLIAIRIDNNIKFSFASVCDNVQEAVTLLEDLPLTPVHGILQSVFKPPKKNDRILTVTGTVLTEENKKIPVILLDLKPAPYRRFYEELKKRWGEPVPPKPPAIVKNRSSRIPLHKPVTILLLRKTPPIGLLPII